MNGGSENLASGSYAATAGGRANTATSKTPEDPYAVSYSTVTGQHDWRAGDPFEDD